jgi:glyoxylase I family protein
MNEHLSGPTLSHVAIRVSDMDRSLWLYRDRLGFESHSTVTVTEAPSFREVGLTDARMVIWFLDGFGIRLELQTVTAQNGQTVPPSLSAPGFRHLAYHVDDLVDTLQLIEAAGGSVRPGTMQGSGRDGAAFASDPDGQRIELIAGDGGGLPPSTPVAPGPRSQPPLVSELLGITLLASDLQRSTEFYVDALGWRLVGESDTSRELAMGDARVILEAAAGRPAGFWQFTLVADRPGELIEAVTSAGGSTTEQHVAIDADGVRLDLASRREP